jgi:hypothetical protein
LKTALYELKNILENDFGLLYQQALSPTSRGAARLMLSKGINRTKADGF